MNDIALLALREMLDRLIEDTPDYPPPEKLLPDRWIAASTLQKGIRRGYVDLVLRALDTLWKIDPRYTRRRLAIIAFEDVGLGNPDVVAVTVMTCSGTKYLPKHKIYPAVRACAIALAIGVKSRTTEHIYTVLSHHQDIDLLRDRFAHKPPQELMDIMIETDRFLLERCAAAWYLAGTKRFSGGEMLEIKGDLDMFQWATEQLDIPPWQSVMTMAGIRVTQCALPIYWPILLSQKECGEADVTYNIQYNVEALHPYVLDQFTRSGKAVIREYLKENNILTRWLNKKLPRKAWQSTVEMGLFYSSSDILDKEYVFKGSKKLKRLSSVADCCRYGIEADDVEELLTIIRQSLDDIDERRKEVFHI